MICFNREQVPYKDFKTNKVIQGKFSERYFFEAYNITDSDHLFELYLGNHPKDSGI
jgi:hypothetical protein